jgi:hypothetical protein
MDPAVRPEGRLSMQLIQHTSCPDRHRSYSDYLATMINERTRDHGLSHIRSGDKPGGVKPGSQELGANVLIWVEGDGELVGDPADGRHRGILIAAHGSSQGSTDGSFIISYPIGKDDHAPRVPAVSGLLEALGWSVVLSQHERTVEGGVNVALLVSTAPVGHGRRLWLTESVGEEPDRSEPNYALASELLAAAAEGRISTARMRNQIEAWVNEGGAGDDVAS